ncbi:MAG: flagellar hook-associated protein 3 [Epulopiscium sp. Nuni2H_MBin001]|nr:MAG: flagellar hook-associated protein 3 [Epulopiscium sp. Nuni2H_MBin001]
MRITNGMMQLNTVNNLNSNMKSMNDIFAQMSTLKKIQTPSDDPIIAGKSLKLKIDVNQISQYQTNIEDALSWMEVSDGALKNMNGIMTEVRTRLTQAANGTLTQEDREKILSDIEQLGEQLKQEANVSYAGRYVFSGFKTDQPVYLEKATELSQDVTLATDMKLSEDMELSGQITLSEDMVVTKDMTINGLSYAAGDTVLAGTTIPAGTTLPENTIIPTGTTIPAGTTVPKGTINPSVAGHTANHDIKYEIGTNTQLEINQTGVPEMLAGFESLLSDITQAISDNDSEAISALLDDMDAVMTELSEMQADSGSRQMRLEFTLSRTVDEKVTFTELLSNTEDVDLEEVFIEYNSQLMVYQAALQATSQIVVNTLADYL